VPVPRTAVLTPDLALDPALWGEFVILKPSNLATTSRGMGVRLVRTTRVRYRPPSDYPREHPGRYGPMIVQEFIDTGARISVYRALTLFGEPLYVNLERADAPRPGPGASEAEVERHPMTLQQAPSTNSFVADPDVIAVARAAYAALPEAPLQGCDILRQAGSGALYVLEVNPGGNTWHFSSDHLAADRAANGPELERQRRQQFDAFRTAARVLVERTRREAE
jgi:glutathione synthase/RimK-type ligase-like ATP-grasp enzyme